MGSSSTSLMHPTSRVTWTAPPHLLVDLGAQPSCLLVEVGARPLCLLVEVGAGVAGIWDHQESLLGQMEMQ